MLPFLNPFSLPRHASIRSSSMIRLALCACMHARARTNAQLAGRPGSTCSVPVNGHAWIHLFRRPAGGGACRGSTGCRAKRHLNVFLFLTSCTVKNPPGRAQSDGVPVDCWLGSIVCKRARLQPSGMARRRRVGAGGGIPPWVSIQAQLLGKLAGGKASGSRDFGTCVYPELELDGNAGQFSTTAGQVAAASLNTQARS